MAKKVIDIKDVLAAASKTDTQAKLEHKAIRPSCTKAAQKKPAKKKPATKANDQTAKEGSYGSLSKEEKKKAIYHVADLFKQNTTVLFEYLYFNSRGRTYFGQANFRAAWVTSLIAPVVRGTTKACRQYADELLAENNFCFEKELMDDRWIVALTGSLYNDVRINFFAKLAFNMTPGDTAHLATLLLENIKNFWAENVIAGSHECMQLPVIPTFGDSMNFLDNYCSTFTETGVDLLWKLEKPNDFTKKVLSMEDELLNENLSIHCDASSWPVLADLRESVIPIRGTIDTRLVCPDKADHCVHYPQTLIHDYLRLTNRTGNEVTAEYLFAKYDDVFYNSLNTLSSLINAERHEYFQAREYLEKQAKERAALMETIEKAAAPQPEEELSSQESLLGEIKELNSRVKDKNALIERLEKRLADTEHDKRDAELKTEEALVQSSVLAHDVKSLQDTMWNIQNPQEETTEEMEELDTSVFDDLNIVCVGGHPIWVNEMRAIHPNLRIYDFSAPDNALANADAVWIQPFNISHSFCFRCSNIALAHNVPIHYFSSTGNVRSKRELILGTQELFRDRHGLPNK